MAKAQAQPPKGTRDFLPQAVRQRDYAVRIIRRVYESYGFQPLETPALERLDALRGKYGEEGDQLLFKVLLRAQPLLHGIRQAADHLGTPGAIVTGRSGDTVPGAEPMLADLGLRYDLTVPLARAYAAHQAELPSVFKRYQIQPVWRADTPGKGRYREFYQCDVDVVGSTSLLVEAEVMSAAAECLKGLGLSGVTLRLNHRGLLRAVMQQAGVAPELEVDAITALDKFDKVGAEGVAEELAGRGISREAATKIIELAQSGATLDRVEAFLEGHAEGTVAVSELRELLGYVESTAAAGLVRFDLSLARGLSYYTGPIVELASQDFRGSLGGGGRYNGLIGMFLGKEVPACGLSLGLERLLLVMEERGLFPADLGAVDVFVGAVPGEDLAETLRLSRRLREGGLSVTMAAKPDKPVKLRKLASEAPARRCVCLEQGQWSIFDPAVERGERGLSADQVVAAIAHGGAARS